jgi:hypothetical protein
MAAALGTTEKEEYSFADGDALLKFKEVGPCYAYLASDAPELRLLTTPSSQTTPAMIRSWTRVEAETLPPALDAGM